MFTSIVNFVGRRLNRLVCSCALGHVAINNQQGNRSPSPCKFVGIYITAIFLVFPWCTFMVGRSMGRKAMALCWSALSAVGGSAKRTETDQLKVLEHRIHFDVKLAQLDVKMDWVEIQKPNPF